MKKQLLTIAITLGLALTSFADPNQGGGLFQRGMDSNEEYYGLRAGSDVPLLPNHGSTANNDANNGPLGSGIAVLLGMGTAYLVGKKRKEQ